MKSRTYIAIAAALSFSCGVGVTEPMPDIPQTVEYDTVNIEYGDEDFVDAPTEGMRQQALVGAPSLISGIAQGVVAETNRILFDHIEQVDEIVSNPPTRTEPGTWIWDYTDVASFWRPGSLFVIRELENGNIGYTWQLNRVDGEVFELFSGQFSPRARINGGQRGSGVIRFNFDGFKAVDEEAETGGLLVIAFRYIGGVRQVHFATFDLQWTAEIPPLTSQHMFTELPNGAGRLQFVRPTDFMGDGVPYERLAIDAVWTQNQSGRAFANVAGGSLNANEVLFQECWDEVGEQVFGDLTPDIPEADFEDGEPSACDVQLEAFELFAPDDTPPQGDPRVPGPHPDESSE